MITDYDSLAYADFLRLVQACDKAHDDTERTTAVLAILTGRTEDELLSLPLPEYMRLTQMASFTTTVPVRKPVLTEYHIGGMTLCPVLKVENMTAGQYIDFQTFIKDETKDIELLSCLLVPKGRRYCDGYDVADVHEALRTGLMTRDGLALKSFFAALSVASIPSMLSCSAAGKKLTGRQRRTMRKARRTLRRSLASGDGWLSRMLSARLAVSAGRPLSSSE